MSFNMFGNGSPFGYGSDLPGPNKPRPYPRSLSKSAKRWVNKHPNLRDGWLSHVKNLRDGGVPSRKEHPILIKGKRAVPKRGRTRSVKPLSESAPGVRYFSGSHVGCQQ